MELEKLFEKFEQRDEKIKSRIDALEQTATGTQSQAKDLKELTARCDNLEASIKTRDRTIDDLKTFLHVSSHDEDATDPMYQGIVHEGKQCSRHLHAFPNAKRARDFGLWAMAVLAEGDLKVRALAKLNTVSKALAEGVNSSGGALVPEVFVPTLIRLKEQYGVFRANVTVVPMASDQQTWPALDGDVTIYCPGEAGTITASSPTFKNVALLAKKLCALTAISSELDEDSAVAIGEIVVDSMARAYAKAEDQIGFLGDGTSTYWGFTGITGSLRAVDATIGNIKSLVVGSGNQYSELVLPDFDKIMGLYPEYADGEDCAFYMHRYFYWTVVRPLIQAYSSNKPTIGETVDSEGRPRFTLRGYPVRFTSVMPKTEANSQICALFGNLRMGCYLGDRRAMQIDRSREVYFASDQIGIRMTQRTAVNAFGVGDTTDPGPIMGLITAAS